MSHLIVCSGTHRSQRKKYINDLLKEAYPHAILIVPTRQYAQKRRFELINHLNTSTLFGEVVTDFTSFTQKLLQGQNITYRLLEDWEQTLLIKSIVLSDEGKQKCSIFSGILAPDNLAEHFNKIIHNLKQTAITPDDFAKKTQGNHIEPWDDILLWVYNAYQKKLTENHWYDIPGIFWQAEVECLKTKPKYIQNFSLVAFDGFDDFTPSEIRLIKSLIPHFNKVVIGINLDPSPNQTDLYQLANNTLKEIKKSIPLEFISFETPPPQNAIEFIAQNLFWRDKPKPFLPQYSAEIKINRYPNRETEIREIAREIKKQIIKEKILPQKIALVYRQISPVRHIIEHVFSEYGIPFRFYLPRKLKETIIGQFVQRWFYQLKETQFSAYVALLHDPVWNIPEVIRDKFFLILQQTGIPLETPVIDLYKKIDKMSLTPQAKTDKQISQEELYQLKELLSHWLSLRNKFKKVDTISNYINITMSLLHSLFQRLTPETLIHISKQPETEYSAFRQITTILKDLPELINEPIKISLDEYSRILINTLNEASLYNSENKYGVSCIDLPLIRNLEFDYIFLGGMEEGIVPLMPSINAIYSDSDFLKLQQLGIPIDDVRKHIQREWLFFQKIFEVGQKGVFLSYAFFSETQRQRTPSLLLREIQDIYSYINENQDNLTVPTENENITPCSPAELKKAVFMFCPEKEMQKQYPAEFQNALSLWKREEKSQNPYLGYLKTKDISEWLTNHFGSNHIYSADQIETYKNCPFLFFAKRVLGLQEWEEELTEPNALMCGAWSHELLHIIFRDYFDILKQQNKEVLQKIITNILQEIANHDRKTFSLPPKTVEITLKRIERYLLNFINNALIEEEWLPSYFEISFGHTSYNEEDKNSTSEPYVMMIKNINVKFSGRIDRIDKHITKPELRIIDYKWKETPSMNEMKNADSIQLMLYTTAVEHHLFKHHQANQAYFLSITKNKKVEAPWNSPKSNDSTREEIENTMIHEIQNSIYNITQGNFPLTTKPNNCDRCLWKTACRYKEGSYQIVISENKETYDTTETT